MPLTLQALRFAVATIINSAAPHWSDADEAPATRAARAAHIAEDIADVAWSRPGRMEPVEVAAALLTIGQRESHWARYVGAGCVDVPKGGSTCSGWRALSYWQLERVACPALWDLPRGTREAQQVAARCAGRHWVAAYWRCRSADPSPLVGAYAGYRSMCTLVADTRSRAAQHRRTRDRLWSVARRAPLVVLEEGVEHLSQLQRWDVPDVSVAQQLL